ncbi:MAG: sugar ABC transporter substrate-binding protein [Rhizobiaceae bacterium]|nr:sugar ABC transporter substrate-binding protein [Rhizobiaceae bacterium]
MSSRMLKTTRRTLAALLTTAALSTSAWAEELIFWERSGANAGMVERLVEMWNEAEPDRQINLTYIPHAEMVAKLAQAIASGDVPDLMGMDLIYTPQFSKAGQLEDITDYVKDWPELRTASPGHMTVATWEDRIYGVPLYADVSALFYNKDLFEQAGLDPNKPPTSLAELREYADKITALGGDVKGYFLPGSCAGCNIFTVGPLLWASGIKIEAVGPGDEPLVGDNLKPVLEWLRSMAKSGNVHEDARAENGETFGKRFGIGNLGMMGTGNFNITLARDANPDMEFGIGLLPGLEPGSYASFIGGDLVVVPRGSKRTQDAVDFMKFILSDEVQVEGYAQLLNLTTRSDMTDNKYFNAEPLVQDVARALDVGQTPFTLTFFEQINSPQGPWLQMLQRVYYTDDDIDQIIDDAKEQMKSIAAQ